MDPARSCSPSRLRTSSVDVVIPALAARLDAALGNDAWSVGHRAAALAFAAALVDPAELEQYAATPAGARYSAALEVLTRYLSNRSDIRGYSIT